MAIGVRATAIAAALVALAPAAVPASAAAGVTTDLQVPNLVQSGVPTTLVADVSQAASLGSPSGTVTFSTGYGTVLATVAVVATTAGTSRATYAWTAPPEPSVPLIASFTPTGANVATSTSAYARPQITSAPVPVALRFTQSPVAGPITLDGVLGNGLGPGSVSFLVDGKGWTGSVLTANGVGSVVWDATPGIHTIVVQYSNSINNAGGFAIQSGSSQQVVNVLP